MNETSFPQRLAEERRARGYTQKQVSEALGISDRTYSKWETGENEMDVASLCRLAEFYEVSPAVFFPADALKPEGVRQVLGALPPGEAAARWFRLHYEAHMGMNDCFMAECRQDPSFVWRTTPWALPPEDPSEERGRAEATITRLSFPNLAAVFAAGDDVNLSLLVEPSRDGFRWMLGSEKLLGAFFRLLAMPGALPCLYFLMKQKNDEFFTAPFLAAECGAAAAEAEAFMESAVPLGLCVRQTLKKGGKETRAYHLVPTPMLPGILALAKLLIPDETAPRRYGHLIGCSGPLIAEEGETP